MKNLLVLQSGGPTAVINSSLAGVIKGTFSKLKENEKVFGAVNGIEGVENDNLVDLSPFKDKKMIDLLKQTPSSYLGSCRKKLPSLEEGNEEYEKIFKIFEKYNIGYVCCIGGNDSMDTTFKISKYAEENKKEIKIVGVPKTIDNDLFLTDHTPGYGSAAKFLSNCMRQLSLDTDVYKMKSVVVVEAMGRNAGWLTAAASLSNDESGFGTDIICIPEKAVEKELLLSRIEEISKIKKTVMLCVSEGIKDKKGNYIKENNSDKKEDKFGHASLGGAGKTVEGWISENLGFKTRSIELSTLQRCFSQGASLCDVEEAFNAGFKGAEFAINGKTGVMVGFERVSDDPYEIKIKDFPVSLVANKEKKIPDYMIDEKGFFMTEEFKKYALPLIYGEPELIYEKGLLQFAPKIF